jgi:hypothetical protein
VIEGAFFAERQAVGLLLNAGQNNGSGIVRGTVTDSTVFFTKGKL